MMSHGNRLRLLLPTDCLEPAVAQLAGGHLDRYLVVRGVAAGVEIDRHQRYPGVLAPLLHEAGVPVGLCPPEVKVAMSRDAMIPQACQHVDERHGVHAT